MFSDYFYDAEKERLEGLEEKVNELDEKLSSVATNDFTVSGQKFKKETPTESYSVHAFSKGYLDFFKEKQPVSGDILSRIAQCEADIRENEVEINRVSSDALTLKQELISELDYRQSISNDRFAALENTQSSAKSLDQVEMDNIWDQLEIVSKKVCNLFDSLHLVPPI